MPGMPVAESRGPANPGAATQPSNVIGKAAAQTARILGKEYCETSPLPFDAPVESEESILLEAILQRRPRRCAWLHPSDCNALLWLRD